MFQIIFGIVFPVVFGLSGLYDLWLGYLALVGATQSARWPSIDGTIRSAEAAKRTMVGEPGVRPRIVYDYIVDGKPFTGERIAFGMQDNFYSGRGFAQKYIERYPSGSRVRVSYDPARPASSVLEPGFSFWALLPTLFGTGTLIVVCLLFAAYGSGYLAQIETR
jgi:hypothetical protein